MGQHKKHSRHSFRSRMRKLWKLVWHSSRSPSRPHNSHKKLRRTRVKVRKSNNLDLNFHESPWGWSLKIYRQKTLLGLMQASTPVSCYELVAPFFAGNREPHPEYRILICCNSNHRQLKLDRPTFERIRSTVSSNSEDQFLEFFGQQFDKDLSDLASSSSVTVMYDQNNDVISANSLLKQIFTLPRS